jgi:hypothetical protein
MHSRGEKSGRKDYEQKYKHLSLSLSLCATKFVNAEIRFPW